MVINIVYNDKKQECLPIADKSAEILKAAGAVAGIYKLEEAVGGDCRAEIFNAADVIAVVGGDGTILRIAKIAAENNKPIVGVNAGRLGYLACIGADNLELLKKLVNGDYIVENRAMILAEWLEDGRAVGRCHCLNDAVVSHGAISTLVDLKVSVDSDELFYRADGIIAATPSGSTAYSMSAGGPIVDPTLDCFILTPVCPHTLQNRALVVNSTKTVNIMVDLSKNSKVYLTCDGQNVYEIKQNSVIKISRSVTSAGFIRLNDLSVYKVFSEKTRSF